MSNDNYKDMYILFHPLIYRSATEKRRLDLSYLEVDPDPDQFAKMANRTLGDIMMTFVFRLELILTLVWASTFLYLVTLTLAVR
jgi:hypothetical protein